MRQLAAMVLVQHIMNPIYANSTKLTLAFDAHGCGNCKWAVPSCVPAVSV